MIRVNDPLLDGNEKKYLAECIDTGWISSEGPFVKRFEKDFASYVSCEYGISVSSGTAALEVALYAVGVGEGDEVIIPSFTIISCAHAVLRLGAIPVLVDVDDVTLTMNVDSVKQKVSARTKAILAVHMYGHPVDMDPIRDLAKKHTLMVVEDAAQAHGAEYKGKRCGSLGDVAAFSFYANKIITTGEGGMVTTNNAVIAEKAAAYRNLSFRPERRFYHTEDGYNFRMTNLQAAVGCAQLERVDDFVAIKRRNAQLYTELFRDVSEVVLPIEKSWAKNVYWMYAILINNKTCLDALEVSERLKLKGIGTRPFFVGMHEQSVFHEKGLFLGERYPTTEAIARQGMYLPSGLTLTKSQIEMVVAELRSVLVR